MAWAEFAGRQKDVYAVWLRPNSESDVLEPYLSKNFNSLESHYKFGIGEGLAGMVWKEGVSAATSQMKQHEWWVFREGCENVSYVCVCAGEAGGPEGVLAIGSDLGFVVQDSDEEILGVYAAALAIAVPAPRKRANKSMQRTARTPAVDRHVKLINKEE